MSVRAMRLSGKRRLVAIALAATGLVAVAAVVAVMSLSARTALGSGTGGGGCISTTGPSCTFKGNSAFVVFGSVSDDGCIYTEAQVQLFDNLARPGHTTSQGVSIYISKFDQCNGIALEEASNFDPNTGAPAFTGSLQFGGNMASATVSGTALMYDWISGSQVFTTSVNLTVTGYGSSSKYSDSQHSHAPGFVMNSHFTGISRAAEAAGTFSDEAGNNLAALPSLNAELQNSSGGTVQIFKS